MKPVSHKNFICIDCKKDTWNEYYMLYAKLWKKINPHEKGMLCIGCAEARLGRKLNKNDFTKVPINTIETSRTVRLQNRLKS
jgi:hypothetical protein